MTFQRTSAKSPVSLALLLSLGALAACVEPSDESGEESSQAAELALGAFVTVSFQNGVGPTAAYGGTTDATLRQASPTLNAGADATLHADMDSPTGTRLAVSSVLRFDASAIPVGSVVQAVTLTINVTNQTSGGGYSLYALRRAFDEANATWNSAASGAAWNAAGARGATDRGTEVLGTLLPTASGKYTLTLDAAGIAAVQSWVATPSKNFGFAIDSVSNMDGLDFDSSEAATAANRPQLSVTYAPPTPAGNGTGLRGDYYKGTSFGTLVTSRTDAAVDFDWGSASPAAGVPVDGFSVRWSGQVLPQYTETYTFFTNSDDGVRVWVNGKAVIDNWTDHGAVENSGSIALVAGTKYDIKVEYFENTGGAVSRLSWSSPTRTKQIIPRAQLFPAASSPPPPVNACDTAKAARKALVAGTYRPGPTTTGPLPCVVLTRRDSDLEVTAPNAIIEGLDIYGSITLAAGATNVTIRNTIVHGPVSTSSAQSIAGYNYDQQGLVIEDSRIDGTGRGNTTRDGIDGSNFTVRRTEILQNVDGVGLLTRVGNVTIEANWIHDGQHITWTAETAPPPPSQPDMQTHNDGIQFQRGSNYVVRGNFIGGDRGAGNGTGDDYNNACLMIAQSRDGTPANHLGTALIENNWFQGGAATINMAYTYGNDLHEFTIRNNRFLRGPGYYILKKPEVNAVLSGNVFDDTSAPVTITTH